jgi:hypothetical protein
MQPIWPVDPRCDRASGIATVVSFGSISRLARNPFTIQYPLRDDTAPGAGVALHVFRNDELIRGRRLVSLGLAIAEAEALHALLKGDGWIGEALRSSVVRPCRSRG